MPLRLTLSYLLLVAWLAVVAAVAAWMESSPFGVLALVLLTGVLAAPPLAHLEVRRRRAAMAGLGDGIASLRAGDYGLRLVAQESGGELADLTELYNQLTDALRRERLNLRQRELLLESALEASPTALVLANDLDRVVYANLASRRLLHRGRRLEGQTFAPIASACPEPLARALLGGADALVTVSLEGAEEVFSVARRTFELNTRRHFLYTLRHMTPSLRRAEVATWKKVIRILGHELNNTIAPLSSLLHSARLIRERPAQAERLDEVLALIMDALTRLRSYVDGYAQFARLPEPRSEPIALGPFLEEVAAFEPFRLEGALPEGSLDADRGQLRQALVNLLKNAREAGSPETLLGVRQLASGGLELEVLDRGPGMDAEAMQRALIPFHSSKPAGSGLGLAISREILEAHGGSLELASREGGGLAVRCLLPAVRWRAGGS